MRRNKLFFIALFFLLPATALADARESIEKANSFYQSANFESAVEAYERAITEGVNNGHLHYNLGNAYYRSGRFGKAIAEYRKALLHLPSDPDVRANLNFARGQTKDKIENTEVGFDKAILAFLPPIPQALLRRIFLTLYCAAWFALMLASSMSMPKAKLFGVSGLFVSSFLALLLYGTRASRDGGWELALTEEKRAQKPAVLVVPEAKVYSGDGEGSQVIFVLHEGAEVMINERRNAWVQLLLPGDRKGWLKAEDIDTIE